MCEAHIAHFADDDDARIVKHIVQPPVGRDRLVDEGLHLLGVCNVHVGRVRPEALLLDLLRHAFRSLAVDVGHDDHSASLAQFLAERAPDPGRAAGHDRHAIAECLARSRVHRHLSL